MRHRCRSVGVVFGLIVLVIITGGGRSALCATEPVGSLSVAADYLGHSRVGTVDRGKTGALQVRLTERPAQTSAAQAAGLKIVVIDGEAAVNIIQQKTAVSPVVEVRDRNDQPVAGAVVKFAIQGGRATFNGARTLTVTTNVAGRAAVSGLTPTTSGAVQISASAAFQGQTAAVTIAQTNVLTAAQAAQAATAAGAGGSSGGASAGAAAAGGGSGGMSATAIGVVSAVVGGGALVATQVGGAASDSPGGSGSPGGTTGGGTSQTTFEISLDCMNLINVRTGQTITFQRGIGRWPTPAEKEKALAGQYAVIRLDDVPLNVFYEGTTWHDGGGTTGGYGDRARANWVATSGTHTVTAMWTSHPQTDSCTFTISR